jgi:hypothetical protein
MIVKETKYGRRRVMPNYDLISRARAKLREIEHTKQAFVPVTPQGVPPAQPPMDPAMMAAGGGMPPMDPAMMAAGGGMPADPMLAAAGGGMAVPPDPSMAPGLTPPAGAALPPDAAGTAAPALPPELYDMVVAAVRQVMQEMGVGAGEAPAEEAPKKKSGKSGLSDRVATLETMVSELLGALGVPVPAAGGDASQTAAGMTAGAGAPDNGEGSVSAAGPLDPAGAQAMGGITSGKAQKLANMKPLDFTGDSILDAL